MCAVCVWTKGFRSIMLFRVPTPTRVLLTLRVRLCHAPPLSTRTNLRNISLLSRVDHHLLLRVDLHRAIVTTKQARLSHSS